MNFNIFFWTLLIGIIFCAYKISIADIRRRIIPDAYLWPMLLMTIALTTIYEWPIPGDIAAIGAIFGYAMAAIIGYIFDYVASRHNKTTVAPIGMGDIKLIGVGGLILGINTLAYTLVITCIIGGIWAKTKHQKYIPFAPFFIIAGILSLLIRFILI